MSKGWEVFRITHPLHDGLHRDELRRESDAVRLGRAVLANGATHDDAGVRVEASQDSVERRAADWRELSANDRIVVRHERGYPLTVVKVDVDAADLAELLGIVLVLVVEHDMAPKRAEVRALLLASSNSNDLALLVRKRNLRGDLGRLSLRLCQADLPGRHCPLHPTRQPSRRP